MIRTRRLVLDVLKPRHPGLLELGRSLAGQGGLHARLTVVEMDAQTETLRIEITGPDIDFDQVQSALDGFGASLHSIDEVEVENGPDAAG